MEVKIFEKPKLMKNLGIAFLFLLTIIFYFGYINGKAFVWDDSLYTFYPGENYLTESVSHGRFPMWMPGVRGGIPFYADIQMGSFYPVNWLLLPFATGDRLPVGIYQALIALHVALAGIFMFLFLRSLKTDEFSAVLGGVTFAFSGVISLHIIHVSLFEVLVWVPLALYFVNRYLETGKIRHYLAIVFAVLMSFLCGHPQISLYTAFLLVAYWLYRFVMKEIEEGKSKAGQIVLKSLLELGKIAGVYVATILTGAVAFFPAFQCWQLSPRQQNDYSKIADQSLPPYYLVNLFVANLFGTHYPAGNVVEYWGFNKDSWDAQRYGVAYWHFWEFGFYAGQFAFFSIVVALFNLKKFERKNVIVFFLITIALALWFSLGRYGGLFFVLSKLLPGLGMFRTPARMAAVTDFALAGLSGILLAEVISKAKDLDLRKPAIAGGIFYGVFLFVFLVAGKSMAPELRKPMQFNFAFKQIFFSIILFAAYWGMTLLIGRAKSAAAAKLTSLGIILLVFSELFAAYGKHYRGTTSPDLYYSDPNGLIPQMTQLEQQVGPFRFGQLVDGTPRDGVFFPQNMGYVYDNVELIEGMGIFHYNKYIDFLRITNIVAKLDIANAVVYVNIDSRTGQAGVGLNPGALPRAKFYDSFQPFADHASILKAIESGALDYHNTLAVVADEFAGKLNPPAMPAATNTASVSIERVSPEHYRINYMAAGPGIIFVSQNNYPGWTATDIIGRRHDIISAFSAFQGIVIDSAGTGTIDLVFDPSIFHKSLLVSVVLVLLLGGGILASWIIDKRKELATQPEK